MYMQNLPSKDMCVRPDSLGDNELRRRLLLQGKSDEGPRKTLIQRYRQGDSRQYTYNN